jgi:hypothetical protein
MEDRYESLLSEGMTIDLIEGKKGEQMIHVTRRQRGDVAMSSLRIVSPSYSS